jgi:hypothetical protein
MIQRTMNNKTRKETQIKFYKAVVVLILIYRYKIWSVTKMHEETIETKGMGFLRSL